LNEETLTGAWLSSDENNSDFRSCCFELTLTTDGGDTAVVVGVIGRFFPITGGDGLSCSAFEV